jgi:hypothetical protein
LGLGRQATDPRQRRVLEGLRHGRVQDGPAIRKPLSAERAAQLLDVQRDAVRPCVDGVDDVARGRQSRPEDQRGHERRLVTAQPTEADLLGDPLRHQPRSPLAQHRPVECLVASIRPDDQERPVARLASQLGQGLQAKVIGPLQILEGQHRGHVRREHIDDVADEIASTWAQRAQPRREDSEQLLPGGPERWVAPHRPAQIEERGREHISVLRRKLGPRDAKAAPRGEAADGADEARLPDAGLTRCQEEVAPPAAGLVEPALGERYRVVTTHDHGREQRADLRHRASLCHALRAAIGRATDALVPARR